MKNLLVEFDRRHLCGCLAAREEAFPGLVLVKGRAATAPLCERRTAASKTREKCVEIR